MHLQIPLVRVLKVSKMSETIRFVPMKKKRSQKVKRYPTDLNDKRWAIIRVLLPEALPNGRPRTVDFRKLINAILYTVRSGCAWRLLPHTFPVGIIENRHKRGYGNESMTHCVHG
jgi:hypothetical protein